ncbi:MAG TPA: LacI family DNA-binding transcriptional regulator, partial [Stenotrophomonas sp.]|nr:LacI family DNA-binding transcriptional regulator [Stenotrophomonas sp.]
MRRPTIKDVAERAKVSLKTVSRVINNEPSVMQATRARVLRAIADLDYEPDPSARNLRSGTPFVIGLVYDNPNPYHIIGVQSGVLAACRETGFGLQINPVDSTSPLLAEELAEWVQRSRLAGLVLTAPMSERPELLAGLAARGIKTVRIIAATEDPGDGPCVYIDDRDAAYEITEHLIQLGHQRIGFLWGGPQHRSSGERYAGYEAALRDYGITVDKHLIVQGDYTFDDGFRGARRLLALREPPTAIFG